MREPDELARPSTPAIGNLDSAGSDPVLFSDMLNTLEFVNQAPEGPSAWSVLEGK
ncbi:MAG: hypothetical protein ACE5GA_00685 [Candidatus Zixiibacteriota bacterium]